MTQSHLITTVNAPIDCVYQIVSDIESYPEFVPACSDAKVLSRQQDGERELVDATLAVRFGLFHTSFTTSNINIRNQSISMNLRSGQLRQLEGMWNFRVIDADTTEIDYTIDFSLGNSMLNMAASKALKKFIDQLKQAFVDRAHSIHRLNGPD